jgi:hypothetical protein
MNAAPPLEKPPVLGRTANRVLLGGLLLALAGAIATLSSESDAFLATLLLVSAFALALAGLPSILFLYYASRQPVPHLPRETRQAIYFSAVCLVLCGVWFVLGIGGAAALVGGAAAALTGVTALVRVVRFRGAGADGPHLGYGRSSLVGAFLAVLILLAIPKFGCACGGEDYKAKAYRTQLKSDLRNLVAYEADYFTHHHRYAASPAIDSLFTPQVMDSVVIVARDSSGFSATATHPSLILETCGVWVGVRPNGGMHDAAPGVPVCWTHN